MAETFITTSDSCALLSLLFDFKAATDLLNLGDS